MHHLFHQVDEIKKYVYGDEVFLIEVTCMEHMYFYMKHLKNIKGMPAHSKFLVYILSLLSSKISFLLNTKIIKEAQLRVQQKIQARDLAT
jgi:hypothetical protein